jgi:hypothetical protein
VSLRPQPRSRAIQTSERAEISRALLFHSSSSSGLSLWMVSNQSGRHLHEQRPVLYIQRPSLPAEAVRFWHRSGLHDIHRALMLAVQEDRKPLADAGPLLKLPQPKPRLYRRNEIIVP